MRTPDPLEPTTGSTNEFSYRDPQIAEEMRLVAKAGNLAAIGLKSEIEEAFSFIPTQFVVLPMEYLFNVISGGGLQEETVAVGLIQTIEYLRTCEPTKLLAESLLAQARCLRGYEGFDTIMELILEAIQVYQKVGTPKEIGRAYITLGAIMKDFGQFYDSLNVFSLAEKILHGTNDHVAISACLYYRGLICQRLQLYPEAIGLLNEAAKLVHTIPHANDWKTHILFERVSTYLAMQNESSALQEIEEYLASPDQGEKESSRQYFPFLARAQLRRKSGDLAQALSDYSLAVNCAYSEIVRKRTSRFRLTDRARLDHVFQEGFEVSLEANNPTLALGFLERSKTISGVSPGPSQNLIQESNTSREAWEHLQADQKRLVNRAISCLYTQQEKNIQDCHENAEWLLAQKQFVISAPADQAGIKIPPLENLGTTIQGSIPDHVLLLEYAVIEDVIWLFAINSHQINAYQTALSKWELTMLVDTFHYECQGLLPTLSLSKLENELLAPVTTELQEAAMVVIVPPAELFGIPFHAMQSSGKLLIEKCPVVYSPSAAHFAQQNRKQNSRMISQLSPCTIIGSPQLSYTEVDDLPGSQEEINITKGEFKSVRSFVGQDATSDRLLGLSEDTQILHIACHAKFDAKYPLLSRLLLADRPVFTFEILMNVFDVDLVILSACQTGEARVHVGGELEGLASAFIAAGARNVVATLWPMADQVGSTFIQAFYEEYMKPGKQSPWRAIRAAQLAAKKQPDTEHLFFWAPFIVFGSPSKED